MLSQIRSFHRDTKTHPKRHTKINVTICTHQSVDLLFETHKKVFWAPGSKLIGTDVFLSELFAMLADLFVQPGTTTFLNTTHTFTASHNPRANLKFLPIRNAHIYPHGIVHKYIPPTSKNHQKLTDQHFGKVYEIVDANFSNLPSPIFHKLLKTDCAKKRTPTKWYGQCLARYR